MAISSDTLTFIGIALLVGLVVILFIHFKPYFEKHDTTLLFIGGLGSGKTLNSVNKALFLYRKTLYWWKIQKLKIKIKNLFRSKSKKIEFNIKKPLLYSNIPILLKSSLNPAKRVYSTVLTKEHLTLKSRLREFSIVLIDEAPLLVNQFNWSNEEVKNNLNEFIAMFRHYVGGYLILNGQAESEIVKQIRVKLNVSYWCFNFRRFWKFYRVSIMQNRVSEMQVTTSDKFVEENTKNKFGLLTKKYNSRCYRERYYIVPENPEHTFKRSNLTTDTIISFNKEKSVITDKIEKGAKKGQ